MKRIAALPAVCCLVLVLGLSAQEEKPAQVAGKWDLTQYFESGDEPRHLLLTLEGDGANLKCTATYKDGQSAGKTVSWEVYVEEGNKIRISTGGGHFNGTVEGDSMQGSWQSRAQGAPHGIWKANRRK